MSLAISQKEYESEETVSTLINIMKELLYNLRYGVGSDDEVMYTLKQIVGEIQSKLGGKYDDRFKGVSITTTFVNSSGYQQNLSDLRLDLPPLSPMRED